MKPLRINFKDIPWQEFIGGRFKVFNDDGSQLRLVEFFEDFVEEDWCSKGHVGYVLEGTMTIDFNGTIIKYKTGDGIWIEQGQENKHKVVMKKGEKVTLVLFEPTIVKKTMSNHD